MNSETLKEDQLLRLYTPSFRRSCVIFETLQATAFKKTELPFVVYIFVLGFLLIYYILVGSARKAKCDQYRVSATVSTLRLAWGESSKMARHIHKVTHPNPKVLKDIFIPSSSSDHNIRVKLYSYVPLSEASKDAVVIHIHGGGFCTLSPDSYTGSLRVWAKQLKNVPIFSIDYRLAPEHIFPRGFLDCFEVYQWILKNYRSEILGPHQKVSNTSTPLKIALIGDSAGGNLITSVTLRCIDQNITAPVGVVALYPFAKKRDFQSLAPSASRKKFFNDPVLHYAWLDVCEGASAPKEKNYVGDVPGHFFSVLDAPSDLWKQFPKTKIIVGTMDPLYDDSVEMNDFLKKCNRDVELVEIKGVSHAFISLADLCKEGKEGNIQCGKWLQQLLE